jgi:hypothetical protein
LTKVESREVLIFGTGQIPMAEVTQIAKELAELADRNRTVFSYLSLDPDTRLPEAVLEQIGKTGLFSDTYTYDCFYTGWQGMAWEHEYLRDFEETDLIVLWLLGDEPVAVEVDFARNVLDADRPLFIANEGMWQVDRLTDDGMYERVPEEIPLHPAQQAHVDDLARVEPNIEHLPEPPPFTGTVAVVNVTNPDEDHFADNYRRTEPVPGPRSAYDHMNMTELKALVKERGLEADKRSFDAMVNALQAADDEIEDAKNLMAEDATILDFAREPVVTHPANGDSFGTTDEDDVPMTDAETISTTQGDMPAEAIAHRSADSKVIEHLGHMVGMLETAEEHHRALAILNAQLANAMLATMTELRGD